MSEAFPKDILLRVGGATLHRFGYPAVAGSRRGPVELPLTFARADASTCATYIDRDGVVRVAEANNLRREWVDLDGDGVRESPGLLLEGSRINSVLQSETFDVTWAQIQVTVSANATAAPDGTTTADKLVESVAASVEHYVQQTGIVGMTASTKQSLSVCAKPAGRDWVRVAIIQKDAATVLGASFNVNTGAIGTVDAGVTASIVKLANGFYRCSIAADSGTGGSNVVPRIKVASADNQATYTGDGVSGIYVWGAQYEIDKPFPSSYIKTTTGTVTRAADSLTLSANCGASRNLTAFSRIARPVHADASGSLGINPGIYTMGSTPPRVGGFFVQANRTLGALAENVAGTQATVAIPAGAEIKHIAQFKNLPTVPAWAVGGNADVGSFNTGATAFSAYANQTLRVGRYNDELFGVLLDLVIFGDLFTYAECSAVS